MERDPREIESILKDSTSGLRDKVIRNLGLFTVAFLAISDEPNEQFEMAGTGTLVELSGKHFILTARHVWERRLKSADQIGVTRKPEVSHRFPISPRKVVPLGPPRPEVWDEWGPDIVLLHIMPEYVGDLAAVKSFWNLSRPDVKLEPPREVLAVDILMGTPVALGTIIGSHAELQITGIFFSKLETESTRGEFDYRDFDIDLSQDGPRDFGGVSGGGLWQVNLYWSSTGEIDWKLIFRGVAFYQFPPVADHTVIRCHGVRALKVVISQATPR